MFHQVPVLPVVVALAAAVLAALLWSLRRTGRLSVPRAAVALALGVYVAGVVAHTVFPVFRDKPVSTAPWSSHLVVVPFAGYEVADAVMNVLVFVPLGVLLALLVAPGSWGRAVGAAAAVSLAIEATQLVTAHLLGGGHVADVNDLVFNTVGGVVGVAALAALVRVPALRGAVDRFRWHPADVRDVALHEAVPHEVEPDGAEPRRAEPRRAEPRRAGPRRAGARGAGTEAS